MNSEIGFIFSSHLKKKCLVGRTSATYPDSGNWDANRIPLSTKIGISSEACT
jgi:hypothetical protein